MPIPSEQDLLAAACHFGHPRQKWNAKMSPYIYGVRRGIHIFDLTKTQPMLKQLCDELAPFQAQGKTILLVSTKQQSVPMIEQLGSNLQQPTVTKKWIPGLLTNWNTLRQRLRYYKDLRHSFASGEVEKYTKKEQLMLRKKLAKLDAALAGVSDMEGLPQALFVVDAVRDNVAVKEAIKMKIPVFGICDSNANPDEFNQFVPANDDATRSIELILNTIEQELMNARDKKVEEPVAAATAV